MNSNFPCVCGHELDRHSKDIKPDMCFDCMKDESINVWDRIKQGQHEFKLDNLKYLEQKALDK